MKKIPAKVKTCAEFRKKQARFIQSHVSTSFNHMFQLRLMLIYNFPSPISIDET